MICFQKIRVKITGISDMLGLSMRMYVSLTVLNKWETLEGFAWKFGVLINFDSMPFGMPIAPAFFQPKDDQLWLWVPSQKSNMSGLTTEVYSSMTA